MTDDEAGELQLRDVQRLVLRPGETLVVTFPDDVPMAAAMNAKEMLQEWFPENHVLVVTEGINLSVIQPGEEASTG